MTPQELKYSVFHLAFQGKLVLQNEAEIITDKTAFAIDDAPYNIPDSWKWNTIGKCCEMYTGNSISESEKKAKYEGLKEGFDYIGTKDVSFEHVITYDNGVRIPFKTDFKIAYKDAILMCIEGGSAGRKIAILDRDVCFGNKLCMFKAQTVLNTFLFYYLQSMEFKKAFMDNMTGIIGGVSIKKLKDILLPIPPLMEQKRIVARIEELLPLIDRYEQAWTKLEDFNKRFPGDMQKSILQMAIQGKLVPQDASEGTGKELYHQIQAEKQELIKAGKIKKEKPLPEIAEDEIPYEIPDSWKWCRLSSLGNTQTGNTPSKAHPEYFGNHIPFIGPGDIQNNTIRYDNQGLSECGMEYGRIVEAGTILQVCIGGSIGKCAIAKNTVAFNQQINTITPIMVSSEYLFYLLSSGYFTSYMKEHAGGTATPIINRGAWDAIIVPLPPLAEQKRIVAKLEELLPLCERLK